MNIADVEDRLRAAYAATDGLYRSAEVLPETDPAVHLEAVRDEQRPQPVALRVLPKVHRIGKDRRLVAICAAVAAVAVVVAGVAALAGRGPRDHTAAVQPPAYATRYMFGENSVPHYYLAERWFDRNRQHYVYYGPRHDGTYTTMWMKTFRPDKATLALITRLPKVPVGDTEGRRLAPHPAATTGPLDKTLGDPTYAANRLLWPIGGDLWAVEAAQVVHHGVSKAGGAPWPHLVSDIGRLASIAASIVPSADDHVAAVKIGYLPPNMAFSSVILSDEGDYRDGVAATPIDLADPFAGYAALSFTDRTSSGAHPQGIGISMALHPAVNDLATANESQLPERYAPWTKATIHGHPAWVSNHAILIQLATDVQVVVDGSGSEPGVSKKQLRRVAESLSRDPSASGRTPYSLTEAVPASALP